MIPIKPYQREPKQEHLRPCFGVVCDVHQNCVRYLIADGTQVSSGKWISRCHTREGDRPLFIDAEFVGPQPKSVYQI